MCRGEEGRRNLFQSTTGSKLRIEAECAYTMFKYLGKKIVWNVRKSVRAWMPEFGRKIFRILRDNFFMPGLRISGDLVSFRFAARREYRRHGLRRRATNLFAFLDKATNLYYYQPLYGFGGKYGRPHPNSVRACSDRWAAIKPELPSTGFALDFGCQNGFFSFSLAAHGLVALGVERDEASVRLCQTMALANDLLPVSFLRMEVGTAVIQNLPEADVVFCLSIFHNWVRDLGFNEADQIMRAITKKTRSLLFFETGQSDQIDASWAENLSFMGENPERWVAEYLVELGFREVRKIGNFAGNTKHPSQRALFMASKGVGDRIGGRD